MKIKFLIICLLTLYCLNNSFAQCAFTAELSPQDIVLCPQGSATLNLSIQPADTYEIQWFKWLGISGFQPELITDWANQTEVLLNQFDHAGYFFFARVSEGDFCVENSDTVLVDGYLFLPPVVQHGGSAETNQNGIWEVACGQDATLELMLPYTQSIVWYRNGTPIAGENTPQLEIIESGLYTVSGAPELCPNYINFLGLDLEYLFLPEPELSISANGSNLTASAGNAWQWFLNGEVIEGATEQVLNVSLSGFYQVEASFDLNCSVLSDSLEIFVAGDESIRNKAVSVGPNPCSSFIYINTLAPNTTFQLIGLDGRIVETGRLTQQTIDTSELPEGINTLKLVQNDSVIRIFKINKIQ